MHVEWPRLVVGLEYLEAGFWRVCYANDAISYYDRPYRRLKSDGSKLLISQVFNSNTDLESFNRMISRLHRIVACF